MRNTITSLIATAAIAITPGCSKQSPASQRCLEIENDIRSTCALARSRYEYHVAAERVNVGTTRLDDLCSDTIIKENDAEAKYREYTETCDVFEENAIKNRIEEVRALRMKICSDAYPSSQAEGMIKGK